MGMFDFFGRGDNSKNVERTRDVFKTPDLPLQNNNEKKQPLAVFNPTSYADVSKIIDSLRTGKTAVVHLNSLKTETVIRVLDMLSGAIYALDGGVYEMEKNIFMFSPSGVEVSNKV